MLTIFLLNLILLGFLVTGASYAYLGLIDYRLSIQEKKMRIEPIRVKEVKNGKIDY